MIAEANVWQKCLDKAHAMGGARLVTELAPNVYAVQPSKGGAPYTVTVEGDAWVCACLAGQHETACYHLGCVASYRWGREMGAPARTEPMPATVKPLSEMYNSMLTNAKVPARWSCFDYEEEPAWRAWVKAGRPEFFMWTPAGERQREAFL